MYSLFGDNRSGMLLLQVIDLIKEVKEMQGRLMVQAEQIENMESKLVDKIEDMESKLESKESCERSEPEEDNELEEKLVDRAWLKKWKRWNQN